MMIQVPYMYIGIYKYKRNMRKWRKKGENDEKISINKYNRHTTHLIIVHTHTHTHTHTLTIFFSQFFPPL